MNMTQTAEAFFEACETGLGWSACAPYCHTEAGFAAQAEALKQIKSLADYCDWMRATCEKLPDNSYETKGFAVDAARSMVLAYGVFRAPLPADGATPARPYATDYVYAMRFRDGKITHMTKIWNDTVG